MPGVTAALSCDMRTIGHLLVALAFAAGFAPAAMAQRPFVSVSAADGSNLAWWIRDMTSRPAGTVVAGLPLARINAALVRGSPRWCQAQALATSSFTSPSPAIRAEIAATMRELGSPFFARLRMGGRPLDAVAGNYRACNGRVAPFLLLVDRSARVPRVAYVQTMPEWQPFIAIRAEGSRLIARSCLECDHVEALSWDRRRARFVWRNLGD